MALALWVAGLVILGVFVFFPVALATDRPTFCGSCHEMDPFHDQWAAGPHATTAQCIDCHVDEGLPQRFAHKFAALGEVKSHFLGDTEFPRAGAADVPNQRCVRCHPTLPKTTAEGFSHEVHAAKGTCAGCHTTTGHNVTTDMLKAAGIFNAALDVKTAPAEFAALDAGTANIKGHAQVVCSRCHNMAKTGCPRCHKSPAAAKHSWKGDCAQCHKAGAKFVFSHPKSADCTGCHTPKTGHYTGQCSQCHHRPGDSWSFSHPALRKHSWSGKPCAKCHPQGYTTASCTCHGGKPPSDD